MFHYTFARCVSLEVIGRGADWAYLLPGLAARGTKIHSTAPSLVGAPISVWRMAGCALTEVRGAGEQSRPGDKGPGEESWRRSRLNWFGDSSGKRTLNGTICKHLSLKLELSFCARSTSCWLEWKPLEGRHRTSVPLWTLLRPLTQG